MASPPRRKSPLAPLDDLIGRGQQRTRNGQPQRFGGLEVNDQLETRRLFDRQIAGLCAFQDLVDIADRAAEAVDVDGRDKPGHDGRREAVPSLASRKDLRGQG